MFEQVPNRARRSSSPGPPPSNGHHPVQEAGTVQNVAMSQLGARPMPKNDGAALPLVFDVTPSASRRTTPRRVDRSTQPAMEANTAFEILDSNGDGVISRSEFMKGMQGHIVTPMGSRLNVGPNSGVAQGEEEAAAERVRRRVSNMKRTGPPPSVPVN